MAKDQSIHFKKKKIAHQVAFKKKTSKGINKRKQYDATQTEENEPRFRRPEEFIRKFRSKQRERNQLRRVTKKFNPLFKTPASPLALVIRLRGSQGLEKKIERKLQQLRLSELLEATFVQLTEKNLEILKSLELFITYGYPDLNTVRQLLYKRGQTSVNNQLRMINSNELIEEKLGKFNILCLEDLVQEIFSVGEHFKKANLFIAPFKLSMPPKGFPKVPKTFLSRWSCR
eukprot:TRINITY_DN2729_c0_g1_i1.p1 TRINITY_DN2729_c0_g1~~TRINITY_DN2729_c0_g1_i1.p1  ORF type:complete len:242 (+),score=41.47 TRINITY_DN2729_c0_g1_i1:38-727(+)